MYTRWRLYILATFLISIAVMLLAIRILRKRGVAISHLQGALFIVGILLILETLIISRLSNFNLGVVMPAFFGVPLVFLAFALPHMGHGFMAFLKWLIVACYGIAAVIFLVCGVLMLCAQHSPKSTKADAVIVLGAAVHGDKVTWVLENRLNTAMEYLAEHPDAICVVSGGQGSGETVTEGSAMKKYLVNHGVDANRVYAEERATNTRENFLYSKQIIDRTLGETASIAFVTTNFHVYRAGCVAARQGINAIGIPAADVWYLSLNNFLRECVGICIYALKGDI
ncbi:MAG: YdcF family protein [Clostridia bacterium]